MNIHRLICREDELTPFTICSLELELEFTIILYNSILAVVAAIAARITLIDVVSTLEKDWAQAGFIVFPYGVRKSFRPLGPRRAGAALRLVLCCDSDKSLNFLVAKHSTVRDHSGSGAGASASASKNRHIRLEKIDQELPSHACMLMLRNQSSRVFHSPFVHTQLDPTLGHADIETFL